MAILKIHIELTRSKKGPRDYELSVAFVNPGDPLCNLYELSCPDLIHIGNSMVFKGDLRINGVSSDGEVACKIVEGDTSILEAEARFYTTTLKEAQGHVVPQFILYATATLPKNKMPYACMLTRYGGRSFGDSWTDNSIYDRYRAFLAIAKLHRLGVLHGDFEPANVVVDDDHHVRIIDFGQATLHDCLIVNRVYRLYQREPSPITDLRCSEVYDTSLMMDIWTPVLMTFKGLAVNMKQAKTVEDIAQIGIKYYPMTPEDQIRRQAYEFMKGYYDHYILRRKQAKTKLAELLAATASTEGSSTSEAESASYSVTSSQSSAMSSQSSTSL